MYFSEQNKKGWRLLGVPFVFAIFLLAVPIATMTTLSFWTQDYLTLIKTLTLDNWLTLLMFLFLPAVLFEILVLAVPDYRTR